MKCYQCEKPAMYQVGDQNIPLCLDCYYKVAMIQQQELENNERWINYLSDEVDGSVGLGQFGPRFPPRPKAVNISGVKMNNITVKDSVVGTINTGSVGSIDQSITALNQLGESNVAVAIKELTEAFLRSGDLTKNQQNELIETLSVLAKEAATPAQQRENSVAHTLLDRAIEISRVANDITEVCEKWWPVIVAVFGYAIGG